MGTQIASAAAAPPMGPRASDWVVWQMIDSLYPTGGFAHSVGLEAAVQERIVTKAASPSNASPLHQFLRSTLHQTANFALPIVYSMHAAVTDKQANDGSGFSSNDAAVDESCVVAAFLEINAHATALFSNHVAKKASFAQGAAMLRLAISSYHSKHDDRFQVLVTIRKESKRQKHPGIHHAVVFALVCALLGVDAATCQRMYLFFVIRDVLSAATRLNLIGPFEASRMQFEMSELMEQVFQAKKNRPIDDSYSSAPVLDLIQAMHDQLYTRIFNS
uniref:Urease accessory protein UreF n=1 Tax=Globisporangium ultimum (strain ATCC 200006 / CBS 805.95 / DAOM BR144) TaxID=431595 RepID=K3X7Q1_GLOUD